MDSIEDKINHVISILRRVYKKDAKHLLLEIISSNDTRIEEDGYDFGETQYEFVIVIPFNKYLEIRETNTHLSSTIQADINAELQNIFNGGNFLRKVRIIPPQDLNDQVSLPSGDDIDRIWKPNSEAIKVFISHISKDKKTAMGIKNSLLGTSGIVSFVAHHDIEPTESWREEILNALSSFDIFIALLTDGFHESMWTDQEIGCALASQKLIIPINAGVTPYGFISKFQQLGCGKDADLERVSMEIVEIIKKRFPEERFIDMWIGQLRRSDSFVVTHKIIERLKREIARISERQKKRIVDIGYENIQVRDAYKFQPFVHELTNEPSSVEQEDLPYY